MCRNVGIPQRKRVWRYRSVIYTASSLCGMLTRFVSAFISYGTFWLSYVTILIPGSGILAAYGDNTAELSSAIGIFFLAWAIFTAFLGYVL